MNPIRTVIVSVAVLLAALASGGEPAPLVDDDQDLIFFHDSRPYLVRFHVQIDGRPLQESWNRYLIELFRDLDRDKDGTLNTKEIALAPNVKQLQQQIEGLVTIEPEPAPEILDLDVAPKDGKVTAAELSGYYRRAGVGPLQVEYSWRNVDMEPLSETLFALLDINQDGKLSRTEVGPDALQRFDRNDNELTTALELMPGFPGSGMVTHTPTGTAPPPPTAPFVLAQRGDTTDVTGKRLVKRYDKDKDDLLSLKESGLDRKLFAELDGDEDERLNAAELSRWSMREPDLELMVPLGQNAGREGIAFLPDKMPRALTIQREDHGGLCVIMDGLRVELLPRRGIQANLEAGRKIAEGLFSRADTDDDVILDTKEIYCDPFEFVGLLRLADQNDDGKLTRQEMMSYLDLQAKLLSCSTFLTLSDRGRTLFELIDADHDSRLNLREAKTVWERIKVYDANGDGGVTLDELPRQFLLTLSHGQTKPVGDQTDRLGYGRALQFGDRVRGPVWFRKMDRNRDGDVSRREFLGPLEAFQKIDDNGDGFLTISEAEQADAALRKK